MIVSELWCRVAQQALNPASVDAVGRHHGADYAVGEDIGDVSVLQGSTALEFSYSGLRHAPAADVAWLTTC